VSEQKSLSVSQAISEIYAMSQPNPVPDPVQPGWVASVRQIAANLATATGTIAGTLTVTGLPYAVWFGIASLLLGALAAKGYLNNRQAS